MKTRAALGLAAAALAGACASSTELPPLAMPTFTTEVQHFAGSSLRGPVAHPFAADAAAKGDGVPYLARIRLALFERFPEDQLSAIASRARLIAQGSGDEPIRSYTTVAVRARVGSGEESTRCLERARGGSFGRIRWLGELTGVLTPGVTASFATTRFAARGEVSPADFPVQVRIEISRGDAKAKNPLSATLAVDVWRPEETWSLTPPPSMLPPADMPPDAAGKPGVPLPPRERELSRETVLLEDAPALDGAPLLLAFHSPFSPASRESIVAVLEVVSVGGPAGQPGSSSQAEALRRTELAIDQAAVTAEARARLAEGRELLLRQMERALSSLDTTDDIRAPVVFMASAVQAELTMDFALTAEPPVLRDYGKRIVAKVRDRIGKTRRTANELADLLEWTSYKLLSERLSSGDLEPDAAGLLMRHAGEAGHASAALEEMVTVCHTVKEIREWLVEMNRAYLASADSAARVRAFDWLESRKLAPTGYDPLAGQKERNKALEAFEAAASTPKDAR